MYQCVKRLGRKSFTERFTQFFNSKENNFNISQLLLNFQHQKLTPYLRITMFLNKKITAEKISRNRKDVSKIPKKTWGQGSTLVEGNI